MICSNLLRTVFDYFESYNKVLKAWNKSFELFTTTAVLLMAARDSGVVQYDGLFRVHASVL